MSREHPTVVIVIPVYGREDVFHTMAQLRALPDGVEWHAIIVDNGNAPALSERLHTLQDAQTTILRLAENCGGAGAYRAGMLMAQGMSCDFVWLLDDDALINDQTLSGLIAEYLRLESDGMRVGAVGSVMRGRVDPDYIPEAGYAVSPITGRIRWRKGCPVGAVGDRTDEVQYLSAASLLTRRSVMEEVGPFADVFIHWDDIEWCLRLKAKGYRHFITSRSYVNHLELSQKPGDWIRYYDVRNKHWCLAKHVRSAQVCAILITLMRYGLALLQGKVARARFIRLGFVHFLSGKCLLRKELV